MQDNSFLSSSRSPTSADGLLASSAPSRLPRTRLPLGVRPEDVPVVAVDDGLPAIPSAQQSIAALRQHFQAQPVWTPEWVRESDGIDVTPVQAAVLVPIVVRPQPTVLLTRRSAHLKTHSGQVAFPGGKVDPLDASAVATALREAQEEVAIAPRSVEILGQLPGYITGTGFEVVPVVGLIPADLVLQPNPGEVDEIFEVPLSFLLNPANHRHHVFRLGEHERQWLSMPYAAHGKEHFIWGVTASIIRNLYRFLQAPV
ncbi:CoA pyrophosphatase [Lampropedia puyangensis]|uniref:CoA pyrophosphatase n=1 Tax=Lampropedia puyangensis TaxID=1330072 RepID=A0A4S8F819_9BURK|nr:CoA pyrophosphatase [Lampropedia puyangensis]THU02805.1 CoA pyrophosphatase [Lampropedia puyangensis]